jgi:hypothetical protein
LVSIRKIDYILVGVDHGVGEGDRLGAESGIFLDSYFSRFSTDMEHAWKREVCTYDFLGAFSGVFVKSAVVGNLQNSGAARQSMLPDLKSKFDRKLREEDELFTAYEIDRGYDRGLHGIRRRLGGRQ